MTPFGRVHLGATGGAAALFAGLLLAAFGVKQLPISPVRAPAAPVASAAPESAPSSSAMRAIQARQLRFERNQGQAPRGVRYLSRGQSHQLSVYEDGMALSALAGDGALSSARLRFVDAQRGGSFEEREPVDARTHYLHGADPARWVRGVQQMRQLRYAEIYPGIDLVYYSRDGELEFDLVVKPGADPGLIRLQASGAKAPFIDADGHLLLDGEGGVLRVHRPVLQQNIEGQRITLDARWVLGERGAVRFDLPAYDKRYPLVIDPVFKLLYSTYLGGVHDDVVGGMVLDANGNAYVVGHSGSEDWPVSGNAVQTRRKNLGVYVRNVVVTKFDAAGTLIWSTFLGGSVNDYGRGIGLDARGRVVIAGQTLSHDFPTTAGALQRQLQGSANAFLAVLSPDGSALDYASLYGGAGGSDATGLKIDPAGRVVIAGSAGAGLPTTADAYQTTLLDGQAAFVAKFDLPLAGAAQLVAASYYGAAPRPAGQNNDNLSYAFALDATGAPWLTGQAFTRSLPVTSDAVIAAPPTLTANCQAGSVALNSAAYVAKLSADLKTLQYASYLTGRTGGQATCAEFGRGIALDGAGNVYVAGSTSSLTFPTMPGALQATSPANVGFTGYAGFVLKLTPDGRTLAWSTYLGGNGGNMFFGGISVDSSSNALWVHGTTGGGSNFPLSADGLQRQFGGGSYDAAIHQLDAATGALKYGTFMGGAGNDDALALALDNGGNAYIAGHTDSRNLAVTPTAFQPAYTAGAFDGNDWFFRILGSGAISSVRPAAGGTAGTVRLQLVGANLQAGAVVELLGPSTLTGTGVSASRDGTNLGASFDLGNAATGRYSLRVRNPDGTEFTKASAFTVEAGGQPKVWANVLGRPKVRTGTPATFTINYGNSGNVDAYLVPLVIRFPARMSFAFVKGLYAPGDVTRSDDLSQESAISAADGYQYVSILVTSLPAGETRSITLELTSAEAGPFWVDAYTLRPYETSLATLLAALEAVIANPSVVAAQCLAVNNARPYVRNCLASMLTEQTDSAYNWLVGSGGKGAIDEATWRRDLQKRFATDLRTALMTVTGRATALGLEPGARAQALGAAGEDGRMRRLDFWDALTAVWEENPLTGWMGKTVDAAAKNHNPTYIKLPPGAKITYEILETCKCPPKPKSALVRLGFKVGKNGKFTALGEPFLVRCKGNTPIVPLSAQEARSQSTGLRSPVTGAASSTVQPDAALLAALGRKRLLAATAGSCPPPPLPPDEGTCPSDEESGGTGDSGGGSCSDSGGSIDPNDKSGPAGDGSVAHYLRTPQRLAYTVGFENLVSASLPAAEVFVTDQIDTAKYDLSTLELGNISWGPYRIDVPPGLRSYATIYNIDATKSVRVAGSLNPTTGLLKWTFTTLDPVTRLPPSDPTLGFLPPNKNGTEGQGYLNFTISPKAGLPDGTRWENSASIVFDANAAIVTPTWVNTLDTTAPVGRVASATQRSGSTDVDVVWSGTDAGSGVRSYTVQVSANGGAYTAWQTGVSATSAVFVGTAGHTYGFHVMATDAAGNTEAAKSAAEASVTVRDPAAGAGSEGGGGGGGGCTIGGPGQRDASLVLLGLAALVLLCRRRRQRRRSFSAPPAMRSRCRAPG